MEPDEAEGYLREHPLTDPSLALYQAAVASLLAGWEEHRLRYVQARSDDSADLHRALGLEPGSLHWHELIEQVEALRTDRNRWEAAALSSLCAGLDAETAARVRARVRLLVLGEQG